MKSLLKRFRKQPEPTADYSVLSGTKPEAPKTGGGLTIRLMVLPLFSVTLAIVLLAAIASYIQFDLQARSEVARRDQAVATGAASRLAGRLQGYTDVMAAIGKAPALAAALSAGNNALLEQETARIRGLFPDVVRVRFLSRGEAQVDESTTPALSYACLELARIAESGKTPPVEVHLFGSKDQHIDLLRPVVGDGGVVGTLLVSLDVGVLNGWLKSLLPKEGGYLQLRQGDDEQALTLAAAGDASLQGGGEAFRVPVAGTAFFVAYAAMPAAAVGIAQQGTFFAVTAVALLLVLVAFGLFSFFAARIVRNDLVAVVKQGVEIWSGQRHHNFDVRLADAREVLAALEGRVQPRNVQGDPAKAAAMQQASGVVVKEEASDDDGLPTSLLFMDQGGVKVNDSPPPPLYSRDEKDSTEDQ